MLEIRGLTKRFGGVVAVAGLDLTINHGELVGLIGPNGAGKTTVFNLITGFLRPTSGNALFEGENVTGKKPHSIAEKGIVRTFQSTSIFPDFTVLQNIVAARHLKPKTGSWEAVLHLPSSRKKEERALGRALEIAQLVGLDSVKDVPARSLPHGHKRILGIAIALAAEPKLLLLDEAIAGMNDEEVSESIALIRRIWQMGTAILLIEHNMRAVMTLCQRLVVLNFGKKIAEGPPEDVKKNNDVIQAYLGVGKHAA
ncbi:MAG: ABC transporter ATP-binding protein [Dehalococcoidia bacterium]